MSDAAVADPGSTRTDGKTEGKKFLILGCGPAALIAARTLENAGIDKSHIRIMSKDRNPSPINGAQFLHRPVLPEVRSVDISITKIGSGKGYAQKVYGDPAIGTSFDRLALVPGETVKAWSLIETYETLFEDYEDSIEEQPIDASMLRVLLDSGEFDEIISTIPPQSYCLNPEHSFKNVSIVVVHDLNQLHFDNVIFYSGRSEDYWYRLSSIFGVQSIEIGSAGSVLSSVQQEFAREIAWRSGGGLWEGLKPTGTDCDCGYGHETKLTRIGRFGMWDRRRLLHQVPEQINAII